MSKRNSENKHHSILASVALASIPVALISLGNAKFKKIFKINRDYLNRDIVDFLPDDFTVDAFNETADRNFDWYKHSNLKHITLNSFEGYKLDAVLAENHDNHKYVILAHDYDTDRFALLQQAYMFDKLGFNILMIDLRGWGDSEGEYTSLGFKESLDILAWVKYLLDNDHFAEIGLYGVGLGGASVLLAGQHLKPSQVKFIISDCAYQSIKNYIENAFNAKPYMQVITRRIKSVLGFELEDGNILKAAEKIDIPTLFIHGDKDTVVSVQDTLSLYEVCNAKKELLILEDSEHGYNCYREGFKDCLQNFVENL